MTLQEYASQGMSYQAFFDLHAQLVKEHKTTGTNQSEAYIGYGKLNQHRMERIQKTLVLDEDLVLMVAALKTPITALVITEGWCGDSAQNVPVIAALEKHSKNFTVRVVLRDEHLPLMDQYLTNGSRSIPKVVFFENESGKALAVWGPRPAYAQQLMTEGKAAGKSKDDISTGIQLWYSKDKTQTMQEELKAMIRGFDLPQAY